MRCSRASCGGGRGYGTPPVTGTPPPLPEPPPRYREGPGGVPGGSHLQHDADLLLPGRRRPPAASRVRLQQVLGPVPLRDGTGGAERAPERPRGGPWGSPSPSPAPPARPVPGRSWWPTPRPAPGSPASPPPPPPPGSGSRGGRKRPEARGGRRSTLEVRHALWSPVLHCTLRMRTQRGSSVSPHGAALCFQSAKLAALRSSTAHAPKTRK